MERGRGAADDGGGRGSTTLAISYARIAGDNRLGNLLGRLVMRTDETRIVTAMKPIPVRAKDDARAEEAIAVG